MGCGCFAFWGRKSDRKTEWEAPLVKLLTPENAALSALNILLQRIKDSDKTQNLFKECSHWESSRFEYPFYGRSPINTVLEAQLQKFPELLTEDSPPQIGNLLFRALNRLCNTREGVRLDSSTMDTLFSYITTRLEKDFKNRAMLLDAEGSPTGFTIPTFGNGPAGRTLSFVSQQRILGEVPPMLTKPGKPPAQYDSDSTGVTSP